MSIRPARSNSRGDRSQRPRLEERSLLPSGRHRPLRDIPMKSTKSIPFLSGYVLFLLLVSCANKSWTKPGATPQEIARDQRECVQMAPSRSQAGSISGNIYATIMLGSDVNNCMRARGYTNDTNTSSPILRPDNAKADSRPMMTCRGNSDCSGGLICWKGECSDP